jgi:hypothetical protein
VRQVFFSGVAQPVRQVVFSAVEGQTDVAYLCRLVGEALASQIRGSVAILTRDEPMLKETWHDDAKPELFRPRAAEPVPFALARYREANKNQPVDAYGEQSFGIKLGRANPHSLVFAAVRTPRRIRLFHCAGACGRAFERGCRSRAAHGRNCTRADCAQDTAGSREKDQGNAGKCTNARFGNGIS